MRVWIDLANSPHPVLFGPIARELERLGHELVVSTRDHAQTLPLTRERWSDAVVIGGRSPSRRAEKTRAIVNRARGLAALARERRPDVAVSHNSYAQTVAARALGIPSITAMDYEYQPANHIAFRCAQRILVPEAFPKKLLRAQGGRATKVWTYPGFKEEVHLYDFEPNPAVLGEVGLAQGDAFVVVRPSPSGATYHQFGNPLFEEALHHLLRVHSVPVVVFARRPADVAGLEPFGDRVIIPSESIDARSLIYYATALLGAGGTMNREAALLGTPAFTVFAGELAAVDRRLIEDGRLRLLSEGLTPLDKQLTSRNGRSGRERPHGDSRVLERFLEAILTPITTGRRQTCVG